MTPEQHNELLVELRAIRAALETKPRATAPAPKAQAGASAESLPPPDQRIENAGDVQVHFGKNSGTPISALSEKQLLWYGADREPQLKNDGAPFPPRPQDVLLKNACRTLWHERRGLANNVATPNEPKPAPAQSAAPDEEVPF